MKIVRNIIAALCVGVMLTSCYSQDDIYKEWVKPGGYNYPAKVLNLSADKGFNRLVLKWEKPMDPSVESFIVYWDNNAESSGEISYSNYSGSNISFEIDDLDDRSYSFNVVNLDEDGNKSVASEIVVSPYGNGWLSSRTERTINQAYMEGNDARIKLTRSTNEMISTKFRYKNSSDEWVELETKLDPSSNEIVLPGALKGKYFEYASCFLPEGGLDPVWRAWNKSSVGISYQLDGKRWGKSATKGQVADGSALEYIFDGQINAGSTWQSAKSDDLKNKFPKILVFDTNTSAGEEFAFTGFTFVQNPNSESLRYVKNVSVYVGNEAYDPNDTDYLNNFGISFLDLLLTTKNSEYTVYASSAKQGKYLSLVFTNSWDEENGYVNLWELIPYGYIPSQAD